MAKAAEQMLERLVRQVASLNALDEQSALDWIEQVGEFDSSPTALAPELFTDVKAQE